MPNWRVRGAKIDGARSRTLLVVVPFVMAASFCSSAAQAAGDGDQGKRLAQRWCAACHVVANDQTHGADNVPTFSSIAKIPGFDAGRIAAFLSDPHPKMPDMQLTTSETADLAAYIVSLK